MKVIYTMDQMQELVSHLNQLNIQGIDNCKRIAVCTQIIDNPIETIEEEEGDNIEPNSKEKDSPKHE